MEHHDLFRAVNERIHELTSPSGELGLGGEPNAYICECAERDCDARISLSQAEFAAVRAESGCYVVVAGHVGPGMELVRQSAGYAVVRPTERARESVPH